MADLPEQTDEQSFRDTLSPSDQTQLTNLEDNLLQAIDSGTHAEAERANRALAGFLRDKSVPEPVVDVMVQSVFRKYAVSQRE